MLKDVIDVLRGDVAVDRREVTVDVCEERERDARRAALRVRRQDVAHRLHRVRDVLQRSKVGSVRSSVSPKYLLQ